MERFLGQILQTRPQWTRKFYALSHKSNIKATYTKIEKIKTCHEMLVSFSDITED